jgi:hypothetical protein
MNNETCNMLLGMFVGQVSVMTWVIQLLAILLGFYAVYRITKIFLNKKNGK